MKTIIIGVIAVVAVLSLTSCIFTDDRRELINEEMSDRYGYSRFKNKIVFNYTSEMKKGFMWQGLEHYWKDVPADLKTFEVLGRYVGKDKNYIFIGVRIVDFVDYNSFKYDRGAYYDKNNVYKIVGSTLEIIKGIDAQSYEVLGKDIDDYIKYRTPFSKDKNHIYLNNEILENVDYKTFKVVCNDIYADKYFIYIERGDTKFPNKNHSTDGFKFITRNNFYSPKYYYRCNSSETLQEFPIKNTNSVRGFNKNQSFFSIDGDVYFYGTKMHDVDLASFKVYGDYSYFASDKNYFFDGGKIIPNINPAELKFVLKEGADYMFYRGQVWDILKKRFREPREYEKESFKKAFK